MDESTEERVTKADRDRYEEWVKRQEEKSNSQHKVEKAPETEHVEDTEKYEPEPEPEPEPEQKPAQIIESGRSSGLTPVPEPERDIDAPVTRKELGLVIQALLQ